MNLIEKMQKINIKKTFLFAFIITSVLVFLLFVYNFLFTRQSLNKQNSDYLSLSYNVLQTYLNNAHPGDWSIKEEEKISKGSTVFNFNVPLMNKVKQASGFDSILFVNGICLSSSIKNAEIIMPKKIQDTVIKKGFAYGKIHVNKAYYTGIFMPIKDASKKTIATWFLGDLNKNISQSVWANFITLTIMFLASLITLALIFFFFYKFVLIYIDNFNLYLKQKFLKKDLAKPISLDISRDYPDFNQIADTINEQSLIYTSTIKNVIYHFKTIIPDLITSEVELQKIPSSLPEKISSVKNLEYALEEYSKEINNSFSDIYKKESYTDKHIIKGMTDVISSSKEINFDSSKLNAIQKIIDIILEQLNMLYVNAAIEVTKAGEAGHSFSVIAEEIRRLGEKSSELSKESDIIIDSIQKNALEFQRQLEKAIEYSDDFFNSTISKELKKKEFIDKFIESTNKDNKDTNEIASAVINYLSKIESETKDLYTAIINYDETEEQ